MPQTRPQGRGNFAMKDLLEFNEVQVDYSRLQTGPAIASSRDAYDYLIERWPKIELYERMYVLLMSRGNQVLGVAFISEGSVSGTVADPKKIFQIALKANASGIIIAHNHPSGLTKPSHNDNLIANKCKEAGRFLDLPVLDNLIITKDSYFSYADEGIL